MCHAAASSANGSAPRVQDSTAARRAHAIGTARPPCAGEGNGPDGPDANSLIWMYGSFDAFDVLYTGRGLSVDEIVELFTTTLERALYP